MSWTLSGRSAVVTGGTRGIGLGIARVLARAGARTAVVSRKEEEAAESAAMIGHDCQGYGTNICDASALDTLMRTVAERQGGIDVLCANAGIFPQRPIEEMTADDWAEVMDVNLKGTFLTVKAALPYLKQSDQARIVLTSSITGPVTGYAGWSHYAASKAGQLGFMRTAALELAPHSITINAVLPGNILTEGLSELGQEYLDQMAAAVPLRRLGHVEDIGNAALFLASREAAYITGQTLIVDGGQTLPES